MIIKVPKCIGWQLFGATCTFYSAVYSFTSADANYYIGHKSNLPFWKTPFNNNTWYYESILNWELQTIAATTSICSDNCFFKWEACKSWLYNEITQDCYHSTATYENKAYVNMANVHTGKVELNFSPPTLN